MVIYAEYLFLENVITGGIILTLTGKIAGVKVKKSLLILGSILCGFYSFILFWDDLLPWCSVLLKIIFSLGIVMAVLPGKTITLIAKRLMIFYLVSFSLGGITIGAAYFTGYYGVTQNSSIYLEKMSYINVMSGCVISYILLNSFAKFIKGRLIKEKTRADVLVEIDNKKARLKGLVDTGNHLKDPFTGKPVWIISLEAIKNLLPDDIIDLFKREDRAETIFENLMKTSISSRIRLIPYKSVGQNNGLLIGIRPDRLTIEKPGDQKDILKVSNDVFLAICMAGFKNEHNEEGYSILLNPSAMEGGIA